MTYLCNLTDFGAISQAIRLHIPCYVCCQTGFTLFKFPVSISYGQIISHKKWNGSITRLNALLFEKLLHHAIKTSKVSNWTVVFLFLQRENARLLHNKSGSLITPLLTKSHFTHYRKIEPKQCMENTLKHLSMEYSFYPLERKASK